MRLARRERHSSNDSSTERDSNGMPDREHGNDSSRDRGPASYSSRVEMKLSQPVRGGDTPPSTYHLARGPTGG